MPIRRRSTAQEHAPAAAVRACIAQAVLGTPNGSDECLGTVTLQPHQVDGASRLREIIHRRRGALLADEVGLGKTYTALAVARHYAQVEVVAPAALRAMWHEACARCGVRASLVTTESLSRRTLGSEPPDLVLVDEAHWFRNPHTQRYRQLARRCRRSAVLLLSATPLHNRPADLLALLALFLGSDARRLQPNEVAALIVRRGHERVASASSQGLPRVRSTRWWRGQADARVLAALEAIGAPIPLRDGGVALALLRLTLLRRYCSSDAALRVSLQRMLARALALLDAARGGSYPSARELCAWLVTEEAIQLALPGLIAPTAGEPNETVSLSALEQHIATLRHALAVLRSSPDQDRHRAALLAALVRRAEGARVVAFSQYDATVRALARRLQIAGVALLTAKGGEIASGRISASALLRQFDPAHGTTAAMHVRLLLATDLLSEGVNLHSAKVVVHLDVPWTAARLEQRVGRLSRLGSPHQEIEVYGWAPPNVLERSERLVARLRAKAQAARRRFGDSALLAADTLVQARARAAAGYCAEYEGIRSLLSDWLGGASPLSPRGRRAAIACVHLPGGETPAVLALLGGTSGAPWQLVALEGRGRITALPSRVLRVAQRLSAAQDAPAAHQGVIETIVQRLRRHMAQCRGRVAVAGDVGPEAAALNAAIARRVRLLPRNQRPTALRIAADVHSLVSHATSAGDRALAADVCAQVLRTAPELPTLAWLERTRATLNGCFAVPERGPQPAAVASPSRIAAMLIGT